ncbi:MAG TPA: HIT family protein [Sphingomicrobium sp.]|jgi:diadenosine tetraphosphate (Ap4A) HIT family hydrolase|nr:HIT family protein [Sphingomicrobium sp.]
MVHETLGKFGYPETVIHEGEHWALMVRPAQPTLGSLVLCATSDARSYADLPTGAYAEQREMVALAERILAEFTSFERINYLMLMMVDPHVHFHVIPRYEGLRKFDGRSFPDAGWPGLPNLQATQPASASLIAELRRLAASR